MPNLDEQLLREMLAPETGEVFLTLLEITGPGISEPIYAVNDVKDHVIGGKTYVGFPFDHTLSTSDGESLPRSTLRISNVSRRLISLLRTLRPRVGVVLKIVTASDPTIVRVEETRLELRQIVANEQTIDFTILPPIFLSARYPDGIYSQDQFRALFG